MEREESMLMTIANTYDFEKLHFDLVYVPLFSQQILQHICQQFCLRDFDNDVELFGGDFRVRLAGYSIKYWKGIFLVWQKRAFFHQKQYVLLKSRIIQLSRKQKSKNQQQ